MTISANRRLMLGSVVLALVPAFAVTHTVVSQYKNQRQRLAQEWRDRGQRDLRQSPRVAVVDFQTLLAYEDSPSNRLRLSEALIAAGRPAEAKAHLLTLWAEEPGNGQINLELGRIAAAAGDVREAVRYYHGAVDGAWETDAASSRREARLELAQLLLSKRQDTAAQAELIALIDDLPPQPEVLTHVGGMLVQAGAERTAMDLFSRALHLNPADGEAARLAGTIAFHTGDYRSAERYFTQAAEHAALDDESRSMRDVSAREGALDPLARGLAARERARRVLECVDVARVRLDRCRQGAATDSDAAPRIADLGPRLDAAAKLGSRALERDTDLSERTMALVFEIEDLPAAACGSATADDRALQLIAGERRAPPR